MEICRPELLLVKEKFPHNSARIQELYYDDADFQALCLDYFSCIQSLQQFKQELVEKMIAVKEYEDISNELEKELNEFISEKTQYGFSSGLREDA